MPLPFRLYLISDRSRMGPDPAETVAALARAGLRAFQWREKDLTPEENHRALRAVAERVARANLPPGRFRLFVNHQADLALALGLNLHLTEASIPTEAARALLPAGALLGRSIHSLERAREADAAGADFVTFGPVYDTPSKRAYGSPMGIDRLREVSRALAIPVIAVGGITRERIPECLGAGAAGVAVIRAVWDAPDPVKAVADALQMAGEE